LLGRGIAALAVIGKKRESRGCAKREARMFSFSRMGRARNSLSEIRLIYEQLTSEKRLRIIGQVAREFADNRAEKLKTLFQQVASKQDINLKQSNYPLPEGIPEYSELMKAEQRISSAQIEYRKLVQVLLERVG
jgi:hypothetical protein